MTLPDMARMERVLFDAIGREPDCVVANTPDWLEVRTPSWTLASRNQVLRARGGVAVLRARIEAVVADVDARGSAHRWVVAPSSSPNLSPLLEAAGWASAGTTLAMARPVAEPLSPPAMPGLSVDRVRPTELEAYGVATAAAWNREAGFGRDVVRSLRGPLGRGVAIELWIARLDGVPVATTALRPMGPLGYLQGAAVVPEARRRGIYVALLAHRLARLRELGARYAVVWADADGSARVCARVGFQVLGEATFLHRDARTS